MTVRRTRAWLLLWVSVGLTALPTSALAHAIGVRGSIWSAGGGFADTNVSTSVGSHVEEGHSVAGAVDSASSYGRAEYGRLGAAVAGTAWVDDVRRGFSNGTLDAYSRDEILIGGASSGFLGFYVHIDGTLHTSDGDFLSGAAMRYDFSAGDGGVLAYASVESRYPEPDRVASWEVAGAGTVTDYVSSFGFDPTTSGGIWRYSLYGRVWFPFSAPSFGLNQTLHVQFGCASLNSAPIRTCIGSSDFANTTLIGGAAVYDPDFRLVPGATITSASGHDYSQPIPSSVPEPGTSVLAGAGLIGLARLRRRRQIE